MKIKIKSNHTSVSNSRIISLFLFQYSIPMLLMRYWSPMLLTFITSMVLVLISLYVNRGKLRNSRIIYSFLIFVIILILKGISSGSSGLYALLLFFEIAGPALVVMQNDFECRAFLEFSFKLSYVNFFSILLYPFLGEFAYMRYGYGMLLTVLFLYIKIFVDGKDKAKSRDLILLAVAFLLMFSYGSRGATVAFLMFVGIDRILIKRKKIVQNTFLLIGCLVILRKFDLILSVIQSLAGRIGVRTYALSKLRMQLDLGIKEASSGRFYIYKNAIETIKQHIVFGVPLELNEEGGQYAHNIFLQAGLDFGILGIIAMSGLLLMMLLMIMDNRREKDQRYYMASLFAIAIGRLMLSSVIWRRPEFWMLFFSFLTFSGKKVRDRSKI